ncbi:hypothetical protein [Chryseobacterium sp. SIMBA_029]
MFLYYFGKGIFLNEKVKVFNFEVEDNHNYCVSEKGLFG